MATQRETVLAALAAQMAANLSALVRRNDPLPEDIPADGLVTLFDGNPGEPDDITLNPQRWHWSHSADIEIVVQAPTPADRDTALDGILSDIRAALETDRTLGGACDYAAEQAPQEIDDIPVEGAETLKGCSVPIVLNYTSTSPLG